MQVDLLKKLGNIDQLAGIRESRLLHGRGQGLHLAEFYNAAGLRFTVIPDRCMDLYELSYKGMNLSFQSKSGLTAPASFNPLEQEFANLWPAGAMVTCGLDNVGDQADDQELFPVHGRIGHTPAQRFGTEAYWEGDDYILRAQGEIRQSQLFGRNLSLRRTITTGLYSKCIDITDVITNFEAAAEPYLTLYHINFGYPLLQQDSRVAVSGNFRTQPLTQLATGFDTMHPPVDDQEEELYLHTVTEGSQACALLYNLRLGLGAYVRFDTENLPGLLQWKRMKSHDYVLALEPCNTFGCNRRQLQEDGRLAMLAPYSSVENRLQIGILEGKAEIEDFLSRL